MDYIHHPTSSRSVVPIRPRDTSPVCRGLVLITATIPTAQHDRVGAACLFSHSLDTLRLSSTSHRLFTAVESTLRPCQGSPAYRLREPKLAGRPYFTGLRQGGKTSITAYGPRRYTAALTGDPLPPRCEMLNDTSSKSAFETN
jgi:hypothetical protein